MDQPEVFGCIYGLFTHIMSHHMHAAKLASTPKAVHRVDKTVSLTQAIPCNSTQAAAQDLPACSFVCVISLRRIVIRVCCSF